MRIDIGGYDEFATWFDANMDDAKREAMADAAQAVVTAVQLKGSEGAEAILEMAIGGVTRALERSTDIKLRAYHEWLRARLAGL